MGKILSTGKLITALHLFAYVAKAIIFNIFRTLPFDELIHRCTQREHREHFICPVSQIIILHSCSITDHTHCFLQDECYYLRAVGGNPRKDIANLSEDYPTLALDINLPSLFPPEKLFSSVLRIASPGVQLWTHYDVRILFILYVATLNCYGNCILIHMHACR